MVCVIYIPCIKYAPCAPLFFALVIICPEQSCVSYCYRYTWLEFEMCCWLFPTKRAYCSMYVIFKLSSCLACVCCSIIGNFCHCHSRPQERRLCPLQMWASCETIEDWKLPAQHSMMISKTRLVLPSLPFTLQSTPRCCLVKAWRSGNCGDAQIGQWVSHNSWFVSSEKEFVLAVFAKFTSTKTQSMFLELTWSGSVEKSASNLNFWPEYNDPLQ